MTDTDKVETIDLTPTWEGILPAYIEMIERSGHAADSVTTRRIWEARKTAEAELRKMARLADAYVAGRKAETKKEEELAQLRAAFEESGGRGVDLADRIDALSAEIEGRPTRRDLAARLLTETDIDGILDDAPPICDICGEFEDQDPTNGREYNWNGETGNHLSCERTEAETVRRA